MKEELIELVGSVEVAEDVQKRIKAVGVRGLDFEKAKELGFFNRISNLLCASHASIMAAYRIYAIVDYMLSEFGGRRNDIANAMSNFDKSFAKFVNFWTDYYAHGTAGREVNEETETLFKNIMSWAQLPIEWNLGDKQREQNDSTTAIKVDVGTGKMYFFSVTNVLSELVGEDKESWCVTKYDTKKHSQKTVEEDMDKASAIMVAKRLSADDTENIYTASIVRDYMEKKTDVVPFKAYMNNSTVGKIVKKSK